MFLLRRKARDKYGIEVGPQGSTCEDVGAVVCCGPLSNCQLAVRSSKDTSKEWGSEQTI